MSKLAKEIPSSVVRRLTKYLACIQDLHIKGVEWIASQELAEMLGVTPSTVRQDLTHIVFSGTANRGYEVTGLEATLVEMLGADRRWRVVIVGAGNLGSALALHGGFSRQGYDICAIVDSDGRKRGGRIGELTVDSLDDLHAVVKRLQIDIGVIAVPAASAQDVANLLVASGIQGILNLTVAHVSTDGGVPVIDSRIVAGLQELTCAISRSS